MQNSLPVGTAAPPVVSDLMSPIDSTIGLMRSLQDAAHAMDPAEEAVVVVSLAGDPIGFLSAEDLRVVAFQDPEGWEQQRCSSLMQFCEERIRLDHSVEGVIQQYREGGTRPLLVFNGDTAVGLLHPSAVRQWCRDHAAGTLEELMQRTLTHDPGVTAGGPTRSTSAPTAVLEDLLRPLGPAVDETLELESIAQMLNEGGVNCVMVTDLDDRAIGLITDDDVERAKVLDPSGWRTAPCVGAVTPFAEGLRVGDTLDDAAAMFKHVGVRLILVSDGDEPVGVLHPSEVFQWCAEHRPELLESLADQVTTGGPQQGEQERSAVSGLNDQRSAV